MSVNFEVKRKITVNGQQYESLDQVPKEFRNAVQSALASGATTKATIHINGKTYSSLEAMPAPLRAIATAVTALAASKALDAKSPSEPEPGAVRAEPVISLKRVLVVLMLAAGLFWLLRLFR